MFLIYDIFYGHNGIGQFQRVEEQLQLAKKQNQLLKKQNQEVRDQINELQQGDIAVEELARSELGLIKPGERFFRVLEPADITTGH